MKTATQIFIGLILVITSSRDADGKIRGILALVVDVTEQVNSRNTISESEQRFKLITEQSPQIIWTTDANGKITFLNQHWFDLTGVTFKEAEESGWERALHEDDVERITERFKHALKTGDDFHTELRFIRKSDKRYIWYASRARAIRDLHGNITQWIGVANDIEEHKSLVKKLEEERDIRTRFVSTLSHDLRTPLTAAKMSAQMLARKMNEPEPQKVLFRISDMMDRADKMIRDLLDANLIKVGEKLPLKIEHMNIVRIVSDTLEELAGIHGDRFVLKETEPIEGHWDKGALRRIIDNLGSNAVKYGYAGTKIILSRSRAIASMVIKVVEAALKFLELQSLQNASLESFI